MELLVLVLNDVEKLEDLMIRFQEEEISGATIINSTGMIHALSEVAGEYFLGTLRHLLERDREENKTIFMAINKEKVPFTIEVIESVIGDLSTPGTGVAFTIPLSFVKGAYGMKD